MMKKFVFVASVLVVLSARSAWCMETEGPKKSSVFSVFCQLLEKQKNRCMWNIKRMHLVPQPLNQFFVPGVYAMVIGGDGCSRSSSYSPRSTLPKPVVKPVVQRVIEEERARQLRQQQIDEEANRLRESGIREGCAKEVMLKYIGVLRLHKVERKGDWSWFSPCDKAARKNSPSFDELYKKDVSWEIIDEAPRPPVTKTVYMRQGPLCTEKEVQEMYEKYNMCLEKNGLPKDKI